MADIVTVANLLSLLRAPLILCLFSEQAWVRVAVILLAMLTDFFDGFLARRLKQVTKAGTVLDPLMDKLFVTSAVVIFFFEGRLNIFEFFAFFTRDISILLFTTVLFLSRTYKRFQIRSIWCGKCATALQFGILLLLAGGYTVYPIFFQLMVAFGVLAFFELIIWLYLGETETSQTVII